MKKKISVRAVTSLLLSAVLFGMPAGAFMFQPENVAEVHAQDLEENIKENVTEKTNAEETEEDEPENTENNSGESDVSGTENDTEDDMECDSEEAADSGTETDTSEGSVEDNPSESDEELSEPECICESKCSQYEYDTECEVCKNDYEACTYVTPSVKITIPTPSGWHKDSTSVFVGVEDIKNSGNFVIQKVQAKVGQNGSWTDITEDMCLEISENCTVYVQVTDQKGNSYEKSRYIECFDVTKPVLNAAVSDGLLSIQAQDTDSGIKVVYVNGYEFTELTNGVLNIRLQQFDAGYPYFTIQAMDNAGNMSEVYKTANPYYTNPETSDSTESTPAEQLPVDAEATQPSSATAQVTEHTKTESSGEDTESGQGKEFYTIQTASEKVFYLIINRDGEEETVYFLTEISENDLLNVTSGNSETLPKNSAAIESAIPTTDSTLSGNGAELENVEENAAESTEDGTENEQTEEIATEAENPVMTYLVLGGLGIAVVGAGYYLKTAKKKDGQFLDEDDDEDEEEEEILEDDEEESDSEDDFFAEDEGSEEDE